MTIFRGILNHHGAVRSIYIYLDMAPHEDYDAITYIGNRHTLSRICDKNRIFTIDGIDYKSEVNREDGETLICGKEMNGYCMGLIYYLLPCVLRPRFFLLTNKIDV